MHTYNNFSVSLLHYSTLKTFASNFSLLAYYPIVILLYSHHTTLFSLLAIHCSLQPYIMHAIPIPLYLHYKPYIISWIVRKPFFIIYILLFSSSSAKLVNGKWQTSFVYYSPASKKLIWSVTQQSIQYRIPFCLTKSIYLLSLWVECRCRGRAVVTEHWASNKQKNLWSHHTSHIKCGLWNKKEKKYMHPIITNLFFYSSGWLLYLPLFFSFLQGDCYLQPLHRPKVSPILW